MTLSAAVGCLANNRIAWRGDADLNDRAPDGRDVTGWLV